MGQSHCEDSPYFIGIQIHARLALIMTNCSSYNIFVVEKESVKM